MNRRVWVVGAAAAVVVVVAALLLRPVLDRPEEFPSPFAGGDVPGIAGEPLARLAVAGDTGTREPEQKATAEQMAQQGRDGTAYDALVLLGDLIYDDGDADLVEESVLQPYAPLLDDGAVLVPVLGNHDYQSDEQGQILDALGRDRSWYVEKVGPVRVVALDSERIDDARQTRWLRRVLARPQPSGTWTIAAMHRPPYSAGQHGSEQSVQDRWAPLFTEHDVALVLSGHDHDYQRSKPIDGVTYVVSGGGAKLRPTGRREFTAVSSSTLHYLDLLVYENRILGRAIDQDGSLVDRFTLVR